MPTKCFFCELIDAEGGGSQMRRVETGEILDVMNMPPGALYFCEEWDQFVPQGEEWKHRSLHLLVTLPDGGLWDIDSRASNCTMPQDADHRCWIRHGDPRKPETVTVDKNGKTCNAGAGSIMSHSGKYHGFLRNGVLT